MSINNGGPAFPSAKIKSDVTYHEDSEAYSTEVWSENIEGMALRDYFAAKAIQGMIASALIADRTQVDKMVWAKVAYDFADALLKAREAREA